MTDDRRRRAMRKVLFASLLLVVVAIGLLHLFTPGHLLFFHNTYRRLSYFPIVLGALWFGVRGGLILAGLSSLAFIPHVLLYMGQGTESYLSELTEIILYLAAGLTVGIIAGRGRTLQEQYRLLSEKLERSYARLHEETAQLIEVEKQLAVSQKFSALGQLSAALAHEIKNPLGSIKGTAEILLDEFPPGHPRREFAEILQKEAARLNATVEEVLQYSRGQRGPDEPAEPLSEVVQRIGSLLESRVRGKGIMLLMDGLEQGRDFFVAGGKIAQVVLNLLLNAIDAVPEKGKIRIATAWRGDDLLMTVEDNGPGVAVADREKIFEPFHSGKEEGTGLGLLISRKIVASYGGALTVRDSALGGALFEVVLPGPQRQMVAGLADSNTEDNHG